MGKIVKCQCEHCGALNEFDTSPLAPDEVRAGSCLQCGKEIYYYDNSANYQINAADMQFCPKGHGKLKLWDGKLQCWECGWPNPKPKQSAGRQERYYCPRCAKYLDYHERYLCEETMGAKPTLYAPVHLNNNTDVIVPVGQTAATRQITRCRKCGTEVSIQYRESSGEKFGFWLLVILFVGTLVGIGVLILVYKLFNQ